ncbi:tRNA lysidine(34) synthetase TilS [Geomonas sp. Red32]|uniref:tRNA lysidine(34) synthetase TilS n=1 Tax=Geomonas sp. Red32 TaxID=2912856 RepID=UPI00202D0444|nr:tRNA lysidine(34) synthetase TilS [Geomonas sp. Red32]MCM0083429.1 tRNA lysidine(34) synthetase TilS [Geomonas sp. Red32]
MESRLAASLISRIRRLRLFSPGETVIVAVSGGADSVALLDILVHLEIEGLTLVVAHLNHSLRGAASDGDEEFVASLASRYQLPFVTRRVDVAALARDGRLSLEDAGRAARYAFFELTANERNADAIALAHHRDDQAETVLIRLLRGSGGAGLSAMSPVRGKLRRPLLKVSRKELENYLKLRGLTWRTDESNADTAILRNSIRHQLIPQLERYNPKVSERLAATAEILSGDEELLEQVAAAAFARLVECSPAAVRLPLGLLLREPRGLRLRLYRLALHELRGDLRRISFAHLEAVDHLASGERPSARLKLPGDCVVSRGYDSLSFSGQWRAPAGNWQLVVSGEGRHTLPVDSALVVERIPCPEKLDSGSRLVAFIDPEAAPFPWTVRNFRPGDRFTPLGMTGEQKVKDLFINEKIPLGERSRVPLIESAGRIIWVAGIRVSEHAKVKATAEKVWRVEILRV